MKKKPSNKCNRNILPTEKKNYTPKGPLTVIVFLTTGLYDVADLNVFGSPIKTSTPGGIDSGVLPSFDPRACVVESDRRAEECHVLEAAVEDAGRRDESGHGEAAAAHKAWLRALPRRGARIAAIWALGKAGPRGLAQFNGWRFVVSFFEVGWFGDGAGMG
ncbi:hypothetical protein CFAM422_005648 [Trichoderma lentiforme]|uniref:Uncharacterized protein n=1 Tax=Trichoderma lentiforme TaxID=1567552 RepID=A0A9P4XGT8_9HYPO|nr:hypothetical protein CFAM422_005648 [Trichoderma lentiforme]